MQDLQRLQSEAAALQRQVAGARDPAARFSGTDPGDTVTVSMDADGRVRSVKVAQQWQHGGGSTELGGAVIAAVQAASVDRLAQFDQQLTDSEDTGAPAGADDTAAPAPRADERLVAALAAQTDQGAALDALRELVRMVEDLESDLDSVARRVQDQQRSTYDGRSGSGHVTVRITGDGGPVGVEYDQRWVRSANELNIGRETLEAFQAAYALAARQTVQSITADSRLGSMAALAGDPAALAERLGLIRPTERGNTHGTE